MGQTTTENTKKIGLPAIAAKARIHFDIWGVRLISILTGLAGVVNLLSAILSTWANRLPQVEGAIYLQLPVGDRLTNALAGCALFLLASSLWRRKRVGWLLAILLLVISSVTDLVMEPGYEVGLGIGLIVLLLLLGRSFSARSDPPSVRWGLVVLASTFVFSLAYGVAGFSLENIHSKQPASFLAVVGHTMTTLIAFYHPNPQPINGFGRYFADQIYVVGIVAVGFALLMLLRPVVKRRSATADERQRVAEIVEKYGRSIVAPMALFDDKRYFFSPGGSVIAYGVRGRGALALGDPIGPAEDAAAAISAFKVHCAENDWQPSFIYILGDGRADYRSNDFDTLCIAYEALVPLASFSLEGHENKDVRHHYTKIARLGYQARFYPPPLNDEILHELRDVSDDWLSTHYGGEKYFLVGCFNYEYIRNSPVIAIHAPNGKIVAFANLVFANHNSEITGDLVRCRTKVESGVVEFLTISMMKWAISQGYETFSLSAVTAYGKGIGPGDPPVAKFLDAISTLIDRLYRFHGIYVYKDKFHPRWEPRYLAYSGTPALVPALLTMLRLYSGSKPLWRYLVRK